MNILIVDDEVFTVRAIQTTLDWGKLGIEKAFSAYNAAKAREIIESEKIDVMICDIEMPKEDGLSLVGWLREQGYMTEVIFLTCHSEFEYARKALKLQVFDYVVKPVDFDDMENVVKKAIDKIDNEQQKLLKTQMGEYWMDNKQVVEERFWSSLLTAGTKKSPEEMEEDARRQDIVFDKDKVYRLVLISVKKIKTTLDHWNDELLMFTLQNMAKEVILKDLYSNRTILAGDRFVIISEAESEADIRELCQAYVSVCKKFMGTSVFCYISNGVFCEELCQTYESLCLTEKNDVAGSQEIIVDKGSALTGVLDELFLPDQVKDCLYRGDRQGFLDIYYGFMNTAEESHLLNYNSLKNIQKDLLQFFLVYMERNHLQAHKVQWLNLEDVESVKQMNQWVERTLEALFQKETAAYVTNSEIIVEKIKAYVLEHLSENMTRESIADQVNLSPDYMSKLFKSEMNTNLSQYIIDERMEKAVLLMRTTKLNVSRIAIEVGCDNFSYFSKLFKRHTGLTPREYRLKN